MGAVESILEQGDIAEQLMPQETEAAEVAEATHQERDPTPTVAMNQHIIALELTERPNMDKGAELVEEKVDSVIVTAEELDVDQNSETTPEQPQKESSTETILEEKVDEKENKNREISELPIVDASESEEPRQRSVRFDESADKITQQGPSEMQRRAFRRLLIQRRGKRFVQKYDVTKRETSKKLTN
eukprot:TRINITY_DN3026_c0_g1_i1.p1 TRINITY_DN3026_c0_g1~~TRINITY_DN3026_c0_g1_i1.p1  ORF type:complete len:187 (+),score=35.91 TRINITY_DN3026_c0_g1_i1:56-616(+)